MEVYDCTLCLFPENCDKNLFAEMYRLLCQLPLTVEYPASAIKVLEERELLSSNSKKINVLPPQVAATIPDFGKSREACSGILFPFDEFGLAGAAALQNLEAGGKVRTAFGGLNNTAATEEVLLALYLTGKLPLATDFSILQQIAKLWQNLTGKNIPPHKPIIGSEIFAVESGIHVDGILKNPKLYEPFAPETVGMQRKIVLGSHSGRGSIREKLKELELSCSGEMIDVLLTYVQTEGRRLKRHLTDEEFLTALGEEYAKRSSIC